MVRQHDTLLYARFITSPTAETATAFKNGALLDAMKKEAQAYLDYCARMDQPQKLKLVIVVRWGEWAKNSLNDIDIPTYAIRPSARAPFGPCCRTPVASISM